MTHDISAGRPRPSSGTKAITATPASAYPIGLTTASRKARVRAFTSGANGTYSAWNVVSWIANWNPLSPNFITVATPSVGQPSSAAVPAPNTDGIVAMPQPTPSRERIRGVTKSWNRNDSTPVPA